MVITIPAHYLIGGVILILLITAGILFAVYGGKYTLKQNREDYRIAVEKAEIMYKKAQEAGIPNHELDPVDTLIQRARNLAAESDYRRATTYAEDAVHHLEYLVASYKPEVEGVKGRFARITDIHGVVEVLPPGAADWITAGLNQILRRGTRIRTRPASTANLKFDDGSTIQMKAESLIVIRELMQDEATQAKSSNIELGVSDIEAQIQEPRIRGSSFSITMPDNSTAMVETKANLALQVNDEERSVVKVFMGRVEVISGDEHVALTTREAVVLDPQRKPGQSPLKPMTIPMPPRLIYPANVQLIAISEDGQNPLYFRWTTIQNAAEYKLDIARDYYFYDYAVQELKEDNKAQINGLEGGNYYWRVSSINSSGVESEPSPFNSFRIVEDTDLESQVKDLTPPKVTIDSFSLLGRIVDIAGQTEPNTTLFVNEQREEVRENGSFRVLVEFSKPGRQTVFIEAIDSAGNVTTVRREVSISESAIR